MVELSTLVIAICIERDYEHADQVVVESRRINFVTRS